MRRIFSLVLAVVLGIAFTGVREAGAFETESGISADVFVERDYGYFLGDLVKVAFRVALPEGHYIDPGSLPESNAQVGGWCEVRERTIREAVHPGSRLYHLSFIFQVFRAGRQDQPLIIPAIPFKYGPPGRIADYAGALPASPPILVSPLTNPQGNFKPAIRWSWSSSSPQIVRGIGVALLACVALFLFFRFLIRRPAHSPSPFRAALKKLPHAQDAAAALVIFRTALNEKAGKAIFIHNITNLYRVFPPAQEHEKELRELVSLSDEISFNPPGDKAGDALVPRVRNILRQMRRSEKWE